ncbi:MAG TPA: hypothetical protein DCG49_07195 [Ruminococcus sp.]|nr:hypothetical protein [Ruminococcus sp.]
MYPAAQKWNHRTCKCHVPFLP